MMGLGTKNGFERSLKDFMGNKGRIFGEESGLGFGERRGDVAEYFKAWGMKV